MSISKYVRPLFINGILASVTFLLVLGIAELAWRKLDPSAIGDLSQVYHPELYATDPPLMEWNIQHREFSTHMKTNSTGFRGREFPKSADELIKPTILFVGDSFVEAMQVEEENRFPDLIGKMLGTETVDVFSLGLSSIDPIQELQQYRVLWHDLRPDIVVHAIFIENDVIVPREDFELDVTADGLIVGKIIPPSPTITSFRGKIGAYCHFCQSIYNLLRQPLHKKKMNRQTPEGRQELHNRLKAFWNYTTFGQQELDERRGWDATVAVVKTFQKEVEERGGMYFVLLIPSSMETYENRANEVKEQYSQWLRNDDWKIAGLRERFLSELRAGGFHVVDWHEEMDERAKKGMSFHFFSEGHLNEYGHRFLAEKLAATIKPLLKQIKKSGNQNEKRARRLPEQSTKE